MLDPAQRPGPSEDSRTEREELLQAIEAAERAIPPLWTLRNFVAVNPFLGFTELPVREGLEEIGRIHHARGTMAVDFYRECRESGRISEDDLMDAIREAPASLGRPDLAEIDPEVFRRALDAPAPPEGSKSRILTYAEALDHADGSAWATRVVEQISTWCAARFDVGQSSWRQPWLELPAHAAWLAHARWDHAPELLGLDGFREYVRELPEDAEETIARVLDQLAVPSRDRAALLARELASIGGWAGHVQYRIREARFRGEVPNHSLKELLAVRLAWDGALHRHAARRRHPSSWPAVCSQAHGPGSSGFEAADREPSSLLFSDLEARLVWQGAYESAFRRQLLAKISEPHPQPAEAAPSPAVQAAFCIDVRSERLRRNLEAVSPRIQTLGFAGFFGFAVEYVHPGDTRGEPRCPALLSPSHRILEKGRSGPSSIAQLVRREERHTLLKRLRLSTIGAFPFVETIGHFFGLRLATDSLGYTRPQLDSRLFAARREGEFEPEIEPTVGSDGMYGLTTEQRIQLAEGMLRNMGLVKDFAPVVLLCGHGSRTTNNAYASGLDCGACGGYPGDVNATLAAQVLNDPLVRESLVAVGITIPEGTRFVAGLHETTTDRVELLEVEDVPEAALETLRDWLEQAGEATRLERTPRLGLSAKASPHRRIFRRSLDWSEVRPEWGLAGNAALIAAPRARTRGVDLDGRCFLHDYRAELDPEGQVLELIMTAPLVVASWINLQYYASTVDNDVFGSGSKVLHNVVGRHGVILGNNSDLRPGLPWQSLHDGERFVHEPMRLQAIIEAPLDRISRILGANEDLEALIENEWAHLIAVEPGTDRFHRWQRGSFQEI